MESFLNDFYHALTVVAFPMDNSLSSFSIVYIFFSNNSDRTELIFYYHFFLSCKIFQFLYFPFTDSFWFGYLVFTRIIMVEMQFLLWKVIERQTCSSSVPNHHNTNTDNQSEKSSSTGTSNEKFLSVFSLQSWNTRSND